ncbi:MAG: ribonuclease III, partial [Ruminococcus sp.]|nr:ribonuclease III [Ruminococcus sp.]
MESLQKLIGYRFKNEDLLYEALSHSSFANESKKNRRSNERLEFLGDSVLSIVVSDHIFKHFKHIPEGELTKLRASLVCESALFEFSKRIRLGEHIFLGKGEENTGGRNRPSIVSDAFEAVIAAIYLDGGMEAVRPYVLSFIP